MVTLNQQIKLFGRWVDDPKYGKQFKAESYEYIAPSTVEGLVAYISKHPRLNGIGPAKAEMLVNALRDRLEKCDFISDAEDDINAVASAAKITRDDASNFIDIWLEERAYNSTAQRLASFGLTYNQISKLIKMYRSGTIEVLEANPYVMIDDIKGIGFRIADEIAMKLGTAKDSDHRIRAGIIYTLGEAENDGHTYMEWNEFINGVNKLLIMDSKDAKKKIVSVVKDMVTSGEFGESELVGMRLDDGSRIIGTREMYESEMFILETLSEQSMPSPIIEPDLVDFVLSEFPKLIEEKMIDLDKGQSNAIRNAFKHRFSVYTGGAGTGKTLIAKIISDIAEENGLSVALAAPTGKAARRMQNVIKRCAHTIHRLLEYTVDEEGHFGFMRNEFLPLTQNVIIVDETSMLDIRLCYHLVKAIDFDHSILIFVGDHNQLPPVGPGNILRDLIDNPEKFSVSILDKVMRQAGVLKKNCVRILSGDFPDQTETEPNGNPIWLVDSDFDDDDRIKNRLSALVRNGLREMGYDFFEDVQILSPQRIGSLGTKALNPFLQRIVQEHYFGLDFTDIDDSKKEFYQNDRVIQTRNNYNLDIMNGTIGTVVDVDYEKKLYHIMFEDCDAPVAIKRGTEDWADLELGYILTVHKAQGSEFPCAVVIMSNKQQFMHSRNWLYTAVTRSRRTAILVGDKKSMKNAAKKSITKKRNTWSSVLLRQPSLRV